MPIRFADRELARPSEDDIAGVRDVVLAAYAEAGATLRIETARPSAGWREGLSDRIALGV